MPPSSKGAATARDCEAHGPPSISTDLLCTTSRAHDIPQCHVQQVRDSTAYTYHPWLCSHKGTTFKGQGLEQATPVSYSDATHCAEGPYMCGLELWSVLI